MLRKRRPLAASDGWLLVVVHTWTEVDAANVNVPIVSARKANAAEKAAYEEYQ